VICIFRTKILFEYSEFTSYGISVSSCFWLLTFLQLIIGNLLWILAIFLCDEFVGLETVALLLEQENYFYILNIFS
jgi:hypothetical protein